MGGASRSCLLAVLARQMVLELVTLGGDTPAIEQESLPLEADFRHPGLAHQAPLAVSSEPDRRGSILVRGLDEKTIERLKERARLHGHSLQQEVKDILERATEMLTMSETRQLAERWRRRLKGADILGQRG